MRFTGVCSVLCCISYSDLVINPSIFSYKPLLFQISKVGSGNVDLSAHSTSNFLINSTIVGIRKSPFRSNLSNLNHVYLWFESPFLYENWRQLLGKSRNVFENKERAALTQVSHLIKRHDKYCFHCQFKLKWGQDLFSSIKSPDRVNCDLMQSSGEGRVHLSWSKNHGYLKTQCSSSPSTVFLFIFSLQCSLKRLQWWTRHLKTLIQVDG